MNTAIILIVIGAVLIILAIIGYVAEKNGLGKKKEEKSQEQISEVSVNESNLGAETWSKDAKPKDEHQETIHKVPTMDDWSSIPTDDLPKVENLTVSEKTDNTQDEPMFPEINSTDLEIPEVETPAMENVENSNETLTREEVTSPIEESTQAISDSQNMDYSFDFSNQETDTSAEPVTVLPETTSAETTEVLSTEPETPVISESETKTPIEDAVFVENTYEPASTIEPENKKEAVETLTAVVPEPTVQEPTPVMSETQPESLSVETPAKEVMPEVSNTNVEPLVQEPQVEAPVQPIIESISEPEVKTEIPTIKPVSDVPIEEPASINEPQQETQAETSIWN